jgi:S1-C subfamily serine protease
MNAVVSLNVVKGRYDFKRPYASFDQTESSGTGFLIEGGKGYVVTAAHVVADSISIIGRFIKTGRKDISLELIGICREKDLALLKINSNDLSLLSDTIPLKFGDSMLVKPGDKIKAIGFPLGTNSVKIGEGIISGFETVESDREDGISRCPTYLQITAPIHPGNSGGPLLNSKDEVIGITMSGKDHSHFAVPSRTFIAIYKELKKGGKVMIPTLSLDWCKTNREIMQKQTGKASTYGIYVRKVYPDSCCEILEKGDIIRRIDYSDFMWKANGDTNKDAFALKDIDDEEHILVTIFLDRFGVSTNIGRLEKADETDETKIAFAKIFTDRKMELPEIMDMIPIGASISLNMCRNLEWYMVNSKYIKTPVYRVPSIYPNLLKNGIDYEIFGGMCITDLSMEVMNAFDIPRGMWNQFDRRLIIVQVFPGTLAYKTDSIRDGSLVKSVFAYDKDMVLIQDTFRQIECLDDLRDILKIKAGYFQINCADNSTFLFSPSQDEDQYVKRTYNIRDI